MFFSQIGAGSSGLAVALWSPETVCTHADPSSSPVEPLGYRRIKKGKSLVIKGEGVCVCKEHKTPQIST